MSEPGTPNYDVDPELRLREYVPVVVEELTLNDNDFTFEEFILRLWTFLDNGNRKIIERLHSLNSLIPSLLLAHAKFTEDKKAFTRIKVEDSKLAKGRANLLKIDPYEFEKLIAEYFGKRGFTNVSVIGRIRDRGVDVIATGVDGELGMSTLNQTNLLRCLNLYSIGVK